MGDPAIPPGGIAWRSLLEEAEAVLPPHEARWIVEEASGFEGDELGPGLERPVTERGVVRFDRMLGRRRRGEPLQYVLGRWAFRTLDLMVDDRVLIPRPETEVVAGVVLAELEACAERGGEPRRMRAADLGTGSGAIGLSLVAERTDVEVVLTDVSDDALAVARANLSGLGRKATRALACHGSWFEALPAELAGSFDIVVSNPPYVADGEELPDEVASWEPAGALRAGPTGLEALRELVDGAAHWLRPGGALVLELAPQQAAPMAEHAASRGYTTEIHPDLAGRDRVLVCRTTR